MKNVQNFSSISSDNNLFDFEHMLRQVRKNYDISDTLMNNKIRQYFAKKHRMATAEVLNSICASYMLAEMDFKKFSTTMDIFGFKIDLVVSPGDQFNASFNSDTHGKPPKPAIDAIYDLKLVDTGMETRTCNALMAENIIHLGDLVTLSRSEVFRLPGIGRASMTEVEATLRKYGFDFESNVHGWKPPTDMPKKSYPEVWDKPISSLKFRDHVDNAFKAARITYIGQLLRMTEKQVLDIPAFANSRHYLDYVKRVLEDNDLYLDTQVNGWVPPAK